MTESGERERADEVEHLVRQCVRGRYTVREAIQAAFEAGRGQASEDLQGLLDMASLMLASDESTCMCSPRGKCMAHSYLDKIRAKLPAPTRLRGHAMTCTVCGLTKKPRGRSAPLEMAYSLCDSDCSGYYLEPLPDTLWPNELDEADSGDKKGTGDAG